MDAALAHLSWTLRHDWTALPPATARSADGPTPWHDGSDLASARAAMVASDPVEALLEGRRALGLPVAARRGEAFCRGRRYGHRPGLVDRVLTKIRRDAEEPLHASIRAVRAYLDVAHTHPFDDGNARSAVLLADWMLGGTRDWTAVLRIPKPPGDPRVPRLMLAVLG